MATRKDSARDARRLARLRGRAEARLQKSLQAISNMSPHDAAKQTHEMSVYQVGLEMQNEELRRVEIQLQKSLGNSRDRLARLYDLAPVGHLILDRKGVVLEANLTAADLIGFARHDLVKKKLSRFVAPESQDELHLHLQQVFTTAAKHKCELQIVRADSAQFTGRLESIGVAARPGRAAECLIALTDVTGQRQVEDALHATNEQYRLLFELNPNPMFIFEEVTLRFMEVNKSAEQLYGWSREEFLRMTIGDIRPPEEMPKLMRRLVTQRGLRAASVGEWRHWKKDGTVFDGEITVSCIRFRDCDARLAMVTDITERKRAEQALRASQQQLESYVESAGDAIYVIEVRTGRIRDCNRRACLDLGYSKEELLELSATDIESKLTREDVDAIHCDLKPGKVRTIDGLHKRKDGSVFPVEIRLSSLAATRPELMLSIVRDITERKKTDEALELAARLPHENPNPVLRLIQGRTLNFANPAARPILAAWGRDLGQEPPKKIGEMCRAALASGVKREVEIMAGDRMYLLSIVPISQPNYINLYFRDITERKKAEDELRELAATLERRVTERTAEVRMAHDRLLQEIERRQQLELGILEVSEREQRRIGRDLHDGVGQRLAAIKFFCSSIGKTLARRGASEAIKIAGVSREIDQVLEEIRQVVHGLHPLWPDGESLMTALGELAASVARLFDIRCRFDCPRQVLVRDPNVAINLYRLIQEALSNAMRHARAANIWITMREDREGIHLTVADDGRGLPPPSKSKRSRGFGLETMKYRAAAIGATLEIGPRPGGGTRVACCWKPQLEEPDASKA